MATDAELETLDFIIIGVYFVCVIAVGLGSMCRSNRGSAEGYFLAGSSMIWLPVGASLFASNIGSEHFIGLAGSGASSGIAVGAFELNAIIILQILGWVFLPVYLAGGVFTMPDYMKRRFGGQRIQMYIAMLSLLLYIFTKISVDLFSGALFIQEALDWNLYPSIMSLLLITAIYTVTGGLAAVIYTDTIQAFIMLGGAAYLCAMSFKAIGGYGNLEDEYMTAYPNETLYENNTCGYPREDAFHMLRAPRGSDLPWPGFVFGQTTASIWYWCADQVIVQRALSAKNLSHGKGATLFAGLCKITPLFFIVMPGMISRILYPDEVACVDPEVCMEVCGSESGCSNLAYPLLVMNILPAGPRGLMLAVMLSALTSSLTSIFNSGSTIFTMDIWRKLRKFPEEDTMSKLDTQERRKYELELMIVGRIFVLVLIGVSILWIPIVQNSQGGQLFHYIQEISAYLSPPIAAVFAVAVLWERLTEPGAFWSLMCGLAVGVTRMIIDFVYERPGCGEKDTRPSAVVALQFHYMYFALLLFLLTVILCVIFSLITVAIPKEYLYRLTFWTRHNRRPRLDVNLFYNNTTSSEKEPLEGYEMEGKKNKDLYENPTIPAESTMEEVELNGDIERSDQSSDDGEEESQGLLHRFYNCFCGLSDGSDAHKPTEQELALQEKKMMDKVAQTKRDKIILNSILVCVLSIGFFLYGWYA